MKIYNVNNDVLFEDNSNTIEETLNNFVVEKKKQQEEISNLKLENIILEGVDFKFITMKNCEFKDCKFMKCKFNNHFINCYFRDCEFKDCELWYADFKDSLVKATFNNCDFYNTKFTINQTRDNIFIDCNIFGINRGDLLSREQIKGATRIEIENLINHIYAYRDDIYLEYLTSQDYSKKTIEILKDVEHDFINDDDIATIVDNYEDEEN